MRRSRVQLLAEPDIAPFMWPMLLPALVPPLVVTFCFWALLPSMRRAIPAGFAGGIAWGATLILCISILPMVQARQLAIEREAARHAKWEVDFTNLPANSPLWEWTPFLVTRDETKRNAVLDRVRRLDRRQSDAETMLERGDFPLRYLGAFDLDPTPAIYDKARNLLRRTPFGCRLKKTKLARLGEFQRGRVWLSGPPFAGGGKGMRRSPAITSKGRR